MCNLSQYPGLPDGAVVAEHLQHEQAFQEVAATPDAPVDQRRGAVVEHDEICLLAGLEIADVWMKVQHPGASQGGQVKRLEGG